jgi:hypothetical protein
MRKPAVFVPVSFCFCLMAPGLASAQHSANGAPSMGTAVPAGSTSSGSGSSSGSGGGGSSSGGSSGDGGGYASGGHRAINADRTPRTANTNNGVFTNYSQLSAPVPTFSRPRNGLPILGIAVPRGSVPATNPSGLTFISGSYNPWIYAYDGFAGMPLFGLYDPFGASFGFPSAGAVWTPSTPSTPSRSEKGVLNLDVRPYDAKVYVDGGLAGSADQFEGLFHKLRLEPGVHRVELRSPGYETVVVNVRIVAGESITYRGTLEKIVP